MIKTDPEVTQVLEGSNNNKRDIILVFDTFKKLHKHVKAIKWIQFECQEIKITVTKMEKNGNVLTEDKIL